MDVGHRKIYIQVSQIPEIIMPQYDVPWSKDFPFLVISGEGHMLKMKNVTGGRGSGLGCGGTSQMSLSNPYRD